MLSTNGRAFCSPQNNFFDNIKKCFRSRISSTDVQVVRLTQGIIRPSSNPQSSVSTMAKRPVEEDEDKVVAALKAGERPPPATNGDEEDLEFEDEFEDEFDSEEDEIFEAGVDGRPDAEREGDESKGISMSHEPP